FGRHAARVEPAEQMIAQVLVEVSGLGDELVERLALLLKGIFLKEGYVVHTRGDGSADGLHRRGVEIHGDEGWFFGAVEVEAVRLRSQIERLRDDEIGGAGDGGMLRHQTRILPEKNNLG